MAAMKELLSKKVVAPAVKREAVAHLNALFGLSERRACRIAGADRKMVRYQSRRAPDTALRGRLRDLANERRRFGNRRLFVLLRREGEPSGINLIYRLYSEEGLTVRKRKGAPQGHPHKGPDPDRGAGQCALVAGPSPWASNQWRHQGSIHDQFACGRRFFHHCA
ncbi:hypothetical protein GCM10011341_06540 [Frigidibacter albus]|nr:hypothetical protein GCM10011341_06540 [Frigidibacter albus]